MNKARQVGLSVLIIVTALAAASGLFFGIRQLLVRRELERQRIAAVPNAPELTATSTLEILPLYEEASSAEELISGHGVAYLLRTDTSTILLDVGNNPDQTQPSPLVHNMEILGVQLEDIDALVISHPHPDHLGGIAAWKGGGVSISPGIKGSKGILTFSSEDRSNVDEMVRSIEPTTVSMGAATTGAMPYPEVFPLSLTNPIGQEQSLVINIQDRGLVLITGCGHPGLEELVERAEGLYSLPVIGIVGGLHYGEAKATDLGAPIEFLRGIDPELVALSPHDSEPAALLAFQEAFPDTFRVLEVGQSIIFP
jgi:7,8-dihydropterin-6-yl-methyl-4-(beta-D-ribofuranosyl)aminobenzene 5'-phosphate synthase